MERGHPLKEFVVVLVDEDLGLSWNESWPKDRIERIKANYEAVTYRGPWFFAREHL